MKTLILILALTAAALAVELGGVDLLKYETLILAICEDVFPAREIRVVALSIKPYQGRFIVLPKEGSKFLCDKYIIIGD